MMLGKRGRPPMRRTTSMTGITVDVGSGNEQVMVDESKVSSEKQVITGSANIGYDQLQYSNMMAMVSPRYQRRLLSSAGEGFHEVEKTVNFLTSCGLCNRPLGPGRDIYMYRGETAFCSVECREKQMKQDDEKEKSNKLLKSKKKTENHHNIHSELSSVNAETSGNNETVAAA